MPRTFVLLTSLAAVLASSGCESPKLQPQRKPVVSAVDHFVRGQMLADRGDVEAALAELGKAIKSDPTLSIAYAAMGDIYRHRGDYEQARSAYESACQTNPFTFIPQYNLGVTYQALADAAETVEKFEEYIKKAIEAYLKALTLQSDDFDSNLNLSACYYQLGQMDLAEKYCRAAAEIDPKSTKALSNLGMIKEAQDDLPEAIKAYKESLELDMHQADVIMSLGSIYMKQGRLKEAMETFEQAAEEDPNASAPQEKIGACYFYMREFEKSEEAYKKALELDATSAAAHRGLGVAYMAQFILDNSKTELRDKALEEWNVSLSLQDDQEDLKKLVEKYTPRAEVSKS